MAKHEDLKKGVWVRVMQPHALDGMVLGPLPADAELPPEEQSYIVAIMPSKQYHSLELIDPPKLPQAPVVEQLREHAEAFQSNPNNPAVAAQLIESLKRLGFLKPKNN